MDFIKKSVLFFMLVLAAGPITILGIVLIRLNEGLPVSSTLSNLGVIWTALSALTTMAVTIALSSNEIEEQR